MIESKETLTGNIISKQTISGGLSINEIFTTNPPLENLEVTPTKEQQVFNHKNSYGYDEVIVDPIPDNYIIPNGTKDITTNGYHQVLDYEGVNVNVKTIANLQSKEVTPTKSVQKITSDNGFDGLNEVKVNPIPEEYIIPDGTLDVAANGDIDVTMFRTARVGVYTPPNLQDKELTINENGTHSIKADEEYDGLNEVSVTVNAIEDLTEELNTYNTELTEQETKIADVIELLQTKAVGESDVKYTPRKICFYKYDGTDLDYEVAKLDTSNITNMDNMFQGCENITSLDLSHFVTDKVTSISAMFRGCTSLTFLDIRNFDFANVTVYNYFLYTVPSNCLIIVKDDIQKNWLLDNISAALNIKTVGEYGG